jgi:RNA binding exosome subunit
MASEKREKVVDALREMMGEITGAYWSTEILEPVVDSIMDAVHHETRQKMEELETRIDVRIRAAQKSEKPHPVFHGGTRP